MQEEGSFSPDRPQNPRCLPACVAEASDGSPSHGAVDFSVAVVLPAGGSGERMGISTPKQFSRILNRPLISYTVQAFERLPWIGVIVVVVAKENHDLMLNIVRTFNHTKVKVVDGGSSRHRSIFCGLRAFNECSDSPTEKPKVVIIHDAVRPFVEADLLMKIALSAKEQGASGAIRPLVSTVIATTAEGFLDHSLERAKYRASEMPQAFLYDIIFQAYQRCSEFDLEFGTECLHLALQYCGTNAKLIDGPPTLWKVTYKRDLAAAESIIKETLSMSVCIIPEPGAVALTRALQKHLATQNVVVTDMSQAKERQADYLIETHNFIHISVNGSNLLVIEETVRRLEDRDHALLYPVVIVWVLLSITPEPCERPNPEKFMSLAAELAERNILLYGINIHRSKVPEQWERSVDRLAGIFIALIRERSTALTGQMFQA